MTIKFVLVLLFIGEILVASSTSFTIAIANTSVSAMTNYTWNILFADTSTRNTMTFIFPTSVTISPSSVSYIGSTLFTPSISGNTVTLATSSASIPANLSLSVIFTNITNPYSALSSVFSFSFGSSVDAFVALSNINAINYVSGNLNSCTWSFNQCTEQTNSQLTINVTTLSRIPAGAQKIVVKSPAVWANQNQRYLTYGASALTCSLSFNGASIITAGVSCSWTSSSITISFTLDSQLSGNDVILAYIQGVMSPPTANTPTNIQYTVNTADSSGNTIDGIASSSACTILPTCVTNHSTTVFSPSTLAVGSQTPNLMATFSQYPTITFMQLDTVEVYYTEPAKLVGCILKVLRKADVYTLVNNSTGSVYANYFSVGNFPNTDYAFNIDVYLDCSSIAAPDSETPTTFLYKFKRNGEEYLQLSGTFTATAAPLSNSSSTLTLSNYQMGATNINYQFLFVNGQALGSSPQIVITFPSDISLAGVGCSMSVGGTTYPTTFTTSSTNLIINCVLSNPITAGSSISIQVSGITNPLQPLSYTFGLTTYYNSSIPTSRTEYNNIAFSATYTAITNMAVTLTPPSFTVYTSTAINISFACPVSIPALSTFTLTFPSQVSQLTTPIQPLIENGNYSLLNSTPTATSTIVTFSNALAIPINSNIIITLSIRAPTYMNTFNSIQLSIGQGNNTYIQSLTSMPILVTLPGTMPATIAPISSITGAISPYLMTLTLTVPHPSTFTVEVVVGSDTQFISTGASCTSICTSLTPILSNTFSFTVNNPYPNSTSPMNVVFNISQFTNSRNIGQGSAWTITTYTSTHQIAVQTASPFISVPNILTGALLSSVFYYRNNTNTVKLQLNLTNLLLSTDYLLFSMDRTTYNVFSTIGCSSIYGVCTQDAASTSNVLVIKVIPNSSRIFANPLEIWIEGLISGANTFYLQTDYITVGSYNLNGNLIDQGKIAYNISCRDSVSLPNNCKTCDSVTGSCFDCYTSQGYFLNVSNCVTSCGSATSYLSFGNSTSGLCETCLNAGNGCLTCINSTACLTCLNSSYYLYTSTLKCSIFCSNTSGFLDTYISGIRVCVPCADPNCLICSTTSYGTCTLCISTTILVSGICSNNCPSPSYYVSNAVCIACHMSCYTCTGPDSHTCIVCSVGYHNASGVCSSSCPSGQAVVPSTGACGCSSICLTCDSNNYANCTACVNTTEFVYNGQCVGSCPSSTYLADSTCTACSTGCLNCTTNLCLACGSNWFIYGNHCYSDCNQVSSQYDTYGSTCILCPSGCDTCSGGTCTSCLSDYTLSASSCIKTCLVSNTCEISASDVVPLPGSISVIVWCIIVLVVRLFSHQNYIPYSVIVFSSLAQFILVLVVIAQDTSTVTVGRLLSLDQSSQHIILGLLLFTLACNYIANFIYLCIFMKYIKPLLVSPQQIDVVSNAVTLTIAVLTNYRFAIVAFSKMFPKPRINVEMAKHLTPVHYICFATLIFSIFPVIAGGIGVSKQQKLSPLYMLCLDLMIIIIFNDLITIWFISSKRDDKYYEDELKKEYASDNMDINITKENIKIDKDASNVNMIVSIHNSEKESQDSDQFDFGESYKKFKAKKTKIKGSNDTTVLIKNVEGPPQFSNRVQKHQESPQPKRSDDRNIFAIENEYEPEIPSKGDVNFEQRVVNPKKNRIQHLSRATTVNQQRSDLHAYQDPVLRSIEMDEQKFDKELNYKQRKDYIKESVDGIDAQKESNLDMEDSFNKMESHHSTIHFQSKEKLPKPRRTATNSAINYKKELIKSMDNALNNKTAMRKKPANRYHQSEATHAQKDEKTLTNDDISSIIKTKVQESSIRKSQNISILTNEQNDLQQISPSYYNIQNQRFHIEDIQGASNYS